MQHAIEKIWNSKVLYIFMYSTHQSGAFLANFHFDCVIKTIGRYGQLSRVKEIKLHYITSKHDALSQHTVPYHQTVCSEHIFCKFHHLNLYLPSNLPQALSTLSNSELSNHPGKGINGDSLGQMSPLFPDSTL